MGVRGDVKANTSTIGEVNTAFEKARRDDATDRAALRTDMLKRIADVEGQLDGRIGGAVDDARKILRTDLEATVAASVATSRCVSPGWRARQPSPRSRC